MIMCPPTSFSDHRISPSRKICSVPKKTFSTASAPSRPEPAPPIVGVVRTTEVRIAPEVGGQLAVIKVHKGDTCRSQ